MIDTARTRDAGAAQRAEPLVWTRRIALGVALVLMTVHFAIYAVFALSLAGFPFDYDQGEGFELNDTVLFSQGQWPYRDNEVFPFYASNYPPLYHLILVPFVWLFGPEYWYGRLMGFAATLITALAIGYAVQRETRNRPVALLSGLAYLASNYIYHIGPLFRQHITMVMFETLAIVTLATLETAPRPRRRMILALLLLLAAGYTKQLAIATCAAAFAYLALRGLRRAFAWGAIFAACAGALFLAINLSTGGEWWLNIITANVNDFSARQFFDLLRQFASLHGALLILAILFAAYELYFDRLSAYSVWFAAALASSVLSGKWGAGDSYFATAIAAMCIAAGIFTARSLNGEWRFPRWLASRLPARMPLVGAGALALFALYGLAVVKIPLDGALIGPAAQALGIRTNTKFPNFYDSAGWVEGYALLGQIPTAQDIANGWRIVDAVKGDPRPILSEEAAFSFRTGKPVITNPTQLLNLYRNGHYDPGALVRMIDEQAFGAVIFRARFYPQPILDAVDRAYRLKEAIPMNGFEYQVLYPDPTWPERRPK